PLTQSSTPLRSSYTTCSYRPHHTSYHTFFTSLIPQPPRSTLFPYTTLFRSVGATLLAIASSAQGPAGHSFRGVWAALGAGVLWGDRKSTRLNSSHLGISYAVFCLKKKKTRHTIVDPIIDNNRKSVLSILFSR